MPTLGLWLSQQGGPVALLVRFVWRPAPLQLASFEVIQLHRFVPFGAHSRWSGGPPVLKKRERIFMVVWTWNQHLWLQHNVTKPGHQCTVF